ncbi:HAD family acid phosphatase [Pokkaliibacter sp. MBI-7]|uniref:phosphatase domain-containing protein n=1 Tax=Pokkaliibacter sp. MBI-7 TaxID=3040600 RepID=UPI0032638D83
MNASTTVSAASSHAMTLRDCVLVDVDGTLATFDPDAVRHWVLGEEKHWDPFFEFMADAPPVTPIVRLVKLLQVSGQAIVICTGRPESHRQATLDWLDLHGIPYDAVYLRPLQTDHWCDEEVKSHLLEQIGNDGFQPWLVIDDRDGVVANWRKLGLTCLQCAPGNF